MLTLRQNYLGSPSTGLFHLVLPHETLLLYPSADAVVILNARDLTLIRILAFWQVFPGSNYAAESISCISVDSGMKLIVAAMNSRIATWSLSGGQHDTWRIHSSLVIPRDHVVTTLDSRSGLLAVGTTHGMSVYTLILENDLPTWSQKWTVSLKTPPSLAHFAPSLTYIATTTKVDNAVRLYSTTTGRQTQLIPHPRPVTNLSWRHSPASSRDDLVLYTVTLDSTLRIFFPVLDSPQHLQLHAAIDLYCSTPFSLTSVTPSSAVFWLDREIICQSLQKVVEQTSDLDDVKTRRLRDIVEEGWDIFLHVVEGNIVLTAVVNVDRRPPTLLKHFVIQQSFQSPLPRIPTHLYVLPDPSQSTITLVSTTPLCSYQLNLAEFFDAQPTGLKPIGQFSDRVSAEEAEISYFVRTPEGKGVGVVRKGGSGEAWTLDQANVRLSKSDSWNTADQAVVLDHGRLFATYLRSSSTLTMHTSPPTSITVPNLVSLFTTPSNDDSHDSIVGITGSLDISHVHLPVGTQRDSSPVMLSLHSHHRLPLDAQPSLIQPVDPMAWGMKNEWVEHDALLSISEEGELAFWVLEEREVVLGILTSPSHKDNPGWRCTGKVKTGRQGIRKARCSSAKKTALITPCSDGDELTIWDSKESEFASGLEFRCTYSQPINDLDWTSTPDMQSILAVGFLHHVELLCQQRMTYFDEDPGWSMCWKIDIGSFIPYPISDSIWLANSSLLIGAGHQMLLYGPPKHPSKNTESLFEYVARQNGPLPDYHPQMLLQCLLWEKIELVKDIIANLAKDLENVDSRRSWASVPVERFFSKGQSNRKHQKRYTMLFDGPQETNEDEGFCRPLVTKLIESLESQPLPHLTPNECASLIVLIQTTLEIDEQRRSLDSNGLRYLISMRSFYIVNDRASKPSSSDSPNSSARNTGKRERLRYRDMVWAFHSESQDILLGASSAACNNKMCWFDARALGISIWLNSIESLKSQMEVIARNEFMNGDIRDPTACSLFYFALGKIKLVHGLWRQAAWHKEQSAMLRFLSNDFTQARWRTAALKNAFALLAKQRFEYAAAFFLLGGSLKDAVNVCLKQLQDFQLALAIARVVEQSNEGPVFCGILNGTVLPTAFREGNRWLASWAFWLLHRRDLGVRVLITPLQDLASILDIVVKEIGEPHYDDPSLALLFSQLRSKTLQAAKGNSEISGRLEFNFVLQIARVFCRMGCHILALDLVQSWSFERPTGAPRGLPHQNGDASFSPPGSPVTRRSGFSLAPSLRRKSSIMIDMDIPSLPPTRAVSPEGKPPKITVIPEEPVPDAGDLKARKADLGSLMKSAKQDVQVPEFDMGAFNF
ncbi:RAVE protein 1 C terminal-domain-containing protein [Rhodocollybia butyracea]|uniref:RAVE protein 1 C terminal-domain-containing protein n=1 Tax=Rhodocollybia butyracea TaxID=206335 RepID=A0A9P5Q7K9_9AGAR|nr:RAVE protein 1 C terminal-domain-containing protein [Rhodocollybia butyracea]